jgi:hypothetical protein
MLECPAWLGLSLAARSVYVEIERLYNGKNNGAIGVGVRSLAKRLGCSKNTAARALAELGDAGFIDLVRFGTFSRHNRTASEYRLTIHRCDLSGQAPSKRFMQWIPRSRSPPRDNTVPQAGPSTEKAGPQSHQRDRRRRKAGHDGPSVGTHLDSTIQGVVNERGLGLREAPLAGNVAATVVAGGSGAAKQAARRRARDGISYLDDHAASKKGGVLQPRPLMAERSPNGAHRQILDGRGTREKTAAEPSSELPDGAAAIDGVEPWRNPEWWDGGGG